MKAGLGSDFEKFGTAVAFPLLASPVAAALLAGGAGGLLRAAGIPLGASACLCAGEEVLALEPGRGAGVAAVSPTLVAGQRAACAERFAGEFWGIDLGRCARRAHAGSAALLSFARGLNDTPKIAGLVAAVPLLSGGRGCWLVGVAMALGGLAGASRVAETMSHRITEMEEEEGLAANLAASVLVLSASWFALPVSTTHVSCGALFGIGVAGRRARWRTIGKIVAAWLGTFPLGALFGAAAALVL